MILWTALYRSVSELQKLPEHFTELTARVAEFKRTQLEPQDLLDELENIAEDLQVPATKEEQPRRRFASRKDRAAYPGAVAVEEADKRTFKRDPQS